MSATFAIAALLTLKDQFTSPLRGAQNALGGLQERLKGVQGAARRTADALRGVSDATSRWATTSAQIAAVGQLTTGFGMESYIRSAVSVEHRLAALGNTAGMSADDLKALDARLTAASRTTNQFKADLLTANEVLIAAGLEWQKALDITPVLGKVATATQANMGDLAQTAFALSSNLKVPVDQMQAAFERLTVAGQSGQFELKDMAREFAKLGASMGSLKFTGLENVSRLGAALQIARRGAGDASEAANNLQNFLAKLAAPEVQKNFKKFGIDLPRLIKGARERGLDPFLLTLKAIQKATGGDEFKLGEIFGDMQVQNFIKPMLLYTEDYKRLVGEINAANGVIEGNFGRMMNTTAERWKQFRIQLETTPMPWLDGLIDKLSSLLALMNEYPKAASFIAAALVGIAGAAIVLKTASIALSGLGGLIGIGGKIGGLFKGRGAGPVTTGGVVGDALSGMAGVQKVWVVNMPGGGLGGALPDIGGKGGVPGKAGEAARTLGARIRSIVAGGWMQLTLAWQTLAAWGGRLLAIGARLATAIAPVGQAALSVLSPLAKLAAAFAAGYAIGTLLSKGIDALLTKLMGTPTTLGGAIYDGVQAIQAAWSEGVAWLSNLPAKMLAIGGQIIDGLLAGLRARWAALKESVSGIASGIADSVRGALGIRSPSRVFAEIGGHLMGGLQLGIERAASLPLAAMRGVAAGLAAPIMAGLRARWTALKESVSGIASGIADSVRGALGIRSPSRVFAEIGGHLMGGLQLGIERAASLPLAAMRGVAAGLAAPIMAGAVSFALLAQAAEPAALAASSPAPIQITVNLNGPASPEAAQDVAAAVRREVERALSEQSRRDALARRARLIDGGIA